MLNMNKSATTEVKVITKKAVTDFNTASDKTHMSLRFFFKIAAIALIGIGVATWIFLIVITNSLKSNASKIYESKEIIEIMYQIEVDLLTHNRESFIWDITKNETHLKERERKADEIVKRLVSSRKHITGKEELMLIDQLGKNITDYFAVLKKSESQNLGTIGLYKKLTPYLDASKLTVEKLININNQQASSLRTRTNEENNLANTLGVIIAFLLVLSIIVILLLMRKMLFNPIIKLGKIISEFSLSENKEIPIIDGPTEIVRINKIFKEMAERLNNERRSHFRFLASIAHDLRNPLSAISLSSQLMQINANTNKVSIKTIDIIYKQCKLLERMVGDLLDTTGIQAGNLTLKRERIDLRILMTETIELYKTTTNLHTFQVSMPEFPVLGEIDPLRISQVLNNLVSNAIKYSPNGGQIYVRVGQLNSYSFIEIQDEGIGVMLEEQTQIFEPFRRTKSTMETIPGVGLGLSTTRKIIEAHGGEVKVTSIESKGSTFSITLPYRLA